MATWGCTRCVPRLSLPGEKLCPRRKSFRLNFYIHWIRFKALVGYDFLDSRAERLLARIPRKLAMASKDLFAIYNSHQPTCLRSIPSDFYTIRTHKYLRRKLHDILAQDA
jgi:hypothetical protein